MSALPDPLPDPETPPEGEREPDPSTETRAQTATQDPDDAAEHVAAVPDPVEQAPPVEIVQHVPGLAPDLPVIPADHEMNTIAQLAVTFAYGDLVPSALRKKPNDVFLVLFTARDLGVSLSTAIREFHVIDGKVTLSPKVRLAMVRSTGLGRIWKDPGSDAESATWHAVRFDTPGVQFSSRYTMDEARNVKDHKGKVLADKDNWKNYPARMLSWRACGYLLDDTFSEVGTGLYSPDEMGAVTDEDGTFIEVSQVEPPAGMAGGKAAPPPEAERPDDETRAELNRRIKAVRVHDEANTELSAWWVERGYPVANEITAKQAAVILAKMNALETKYGITQTPGPESDAETDVSAPGASDPGQPGESSSDPVAAPEASTTPPETPDPGEVADTFAAEPDDQGRTGVPSEETLAEIAGLRDDGDVVGWLIERAKIMNRASIESYAMHQGVEKPQGDMNAVRRWWCETEAQRVWAGLLALVRSAPVALAFCPR